MKSKICIVAMFLILGLEAIFITKFVAMFMIYLRAKFHSAVKPIAIYTFHVTSNALS
jgi:hypothetical protein